MAASAGYTTYGSTLAYSTDGNSYTTIAEIVDLPAPNMKATDVDFSHLTSDNNFKEFKAGMKDGGNPSLDINYLATQSNTLYGHFVAGTILYWKASLSDVLNSTGTVWTFRGHINAFEGGNAKTDGKLEAKIGIKVTGKPNLAVPT